MVKTPNTPLTALPVNGTAYTVGTAIGNGIVGYAGTSTSLSSNGLSMNTSYTYTIFPYNDQNCMGAPVYKYNEYVECTTSTLGPKKYTWVPQNGTAS